MTPVITVLIADDHPIFRTELRQIIESDAGVRVVGEAANGDEAVATIESVRPDVSVLDIDMRPLVQRGNHTTCVCNRLCGLLQRHARLEPRQCLGAYAASLKHLRRESERSPQWNFAIEVRRQNPDNRRGCVVEAQRASEYSGVAAEACLPEAVAKHHDRRRALVRVRGLDAAADHRRDAKHTEVAA